MTSASGPTPRSGSLPFNSTRRGRVPRTRLRKTLTAILCSHAFCFSSRTRSGGYVMKAFRALDRFRAGADLRPWLLRIVANEARNRVRSSGRRHQLELRLTEGFRPGDAAPSPEAVAVAADERRRLLETINALSEDDRLVIASRYFLDLSGEETAAALGIPEGTVKSRLSRALARLKARVEEAASA